MAHILWGKVYFQDRYAGILRQQDDGEGIAFTYDASYLNDGMAIAHTLPLRSEPYVSQVGLPAYFDNLVAEGWLEQVQSRLLGRREVSRFELLLAFGYDCIGAISIIDPEPSRLSDALIDMDSAKDVAATMSRASLSGIQPKLAVVERKGQYYAAKQGEMSTHIAKFPSIKHVDLLYNEYLTTIAMKALLPREDVADVFINSIDELSEPALIIKRFDRRASEGKVERFHFEEFNQLLGYRSNQKYDANYKDMADFIHVTPGCLPIENFRLFNRILAGLLLGNTDMHLKNFAMSYSADGLRLAPAYDLVASALYGYKTIALHLAGTNDLLLSDLKAKHIVMLGDEFKLPREAIHMAVKQLADRKEDAKQRIIDEKTKIPQLKDKLINFMETRWNGTFTSIGKLLSKKR